MKFAPIVPIPMLRSVKTDYHMVLAPLANQQAYMFHYETVDGWVILDNGVAEGIRMPPRTLLDLAESLQANEVVAPDVMHDTFKTQQLLVRFCRAAKERNVPVMAVLQATNWIEFGRMLETALSCEIVSVALPKLLTKHMGENARLAAAELVREQTELPIHCLGSSANPYEVRDLARQGIVRGLDSVAPVVLGIKGILLKEHGKHVEYNWELSHKAISNFWHRESNETVEANLATYFSWCETSPLS